MQPVVKKRPKSGKKKKVPQSYNAYYQPSQPKKKKGKKGLKKKKAVYEGEGVMMNNYFPALEGEGHMAGIGQEQEQIDEVPPEQEEGES